MFTWGVARGWYEAGVGLRRNPENNQARARRQGNILSSANDGPACLSAAHAAVEGSARTLETMLRQRRGSRPGWLFRGLTTKQRRGAAATIGTAAPIASTALTVRRFLRFAEGEDERGIGRICWIGRSECVFESPVRCVCETIRLWVCVQAPLETFNGRRAAGGGGRDVGSAPDAGGPRDG